MIPYPTTTVQLLSPTTQEGAGGDDDWGGAPDPTTGYSELGSPVRAHMSSPSGSAIVTQDASTAGVTFKLICDPCDIRPDMQVRDEGTGVIYQVAWCQLRPGLMTHVEAGVTYVTDSP